MKKIILSVSVSLVFGLMLVLGGIAAPIRILPWT